MLSHVAEEDVPKKGKNKIVTVNLMKNTMTYTQHKSSSIPGRHTFGVFSSRQSLVLLYHVSLSL